MPIVFAPPSPAGNFPGMSMEGGRGEALLKTLPIIQQALEARMRAASQAGENRTRASIASAQIGQQADEANGRLALGGAEIGARQASEMARLQNQQSLQQAAQQHDAMMQERALQSRMQLMDAEVPQQLKMQHQQLQTAKVSAYEALAKGEIDKPTFDAVMAKAHGVGDPIQRKLAESSLIQEQAQAQRAQQQAEMISNLMGGQKAAELGFWHKTANQLAGNPNPQPGAIQAIPVVDKDGQVIGHQVLSPEGKTTWAQKEQTIRGLQPKDYSSVMTDLFGMAQKALTKEEPDGGTDNKGNPTMKKVSPDPKAVMKMTKELAEEFFAGVDEETNKRKPGYKPPAPPALPPPSAGAGSIGDMGRRPGMVGGSDAPVQGMSAPSQPQESAFGGTPFKLEEIDKASPVARGTINDLLQLKDAARRGTGYNEDHRNILMGLADEAMRLVADAGSPINLRGADAEKFMRAMKMLQDAKKLAPAPAQPSAVRRLLAPSDPQLHLQGSYSN